MEKQKWRVKLIITFHIPRSYSSFDNTSKLSVHHYVSSFFLTNSLSLTSLVLSLFLSLFLAHSLTFSLPLSADTDTLCIGYTLFQIWSERRY